MSTKIMDRTTRNIVQAGRLMFGRFGFAKTTMADIAKQAGVSRQTVYNAFDCKEDILRAVTRAIGQDSLSELAAAWELDETLEQKLATFQRVGPLSWFTEVRAAPDWSDILHGLSTTAAEELAETENAWVAMLEDMLRRHVRDFEGKPIDTGDVSRFFYSSSKNAKYGVDDPAEMTRTLAMILEATMALLVARGYKFEKHPE